MNDNDENLLVFLREFSFTDQELNYVLDELNSYRSFPGTTIRRYMNRVINSLEPDERHAFLKGIMLGIAIRRAADALSEPDLSDEEKRISGEIEKQRFGK